MIVLDDNFTTIINVARWGRAVYINIQKFVQFQLTVNIVALVINFVSACITGVGIIYSILSPMPVCHDHSISEFLDIPYRNDNILTLVSQGVLLSQRCNCCGSI